MTCADDIVHVLLSDLRVSQLPRELEPILVPNGKWAAFTIAREFMYTYEHHITNGLLFPQTSQ